MAEPAGGGSSVQSHALATTQGGRASTPWRCASFTIDDGL